MAISIDPSLQPVLLEEVDGLIDSLHTPQARAPYAALRESLAAGAVEPSAQPPLERLLDILLHSGRVRHIHGPQAEQATLRLFHQTPRGAAIRAATSQVNTALSMLVGQTIEDIQFTLKNPGVYRLVIDTDLAEISLEINADGVWVENVEVGI